MSLQVPLPEGKPHQQTSRNITDRTPVEVLAYIFQFYIEPDSEATRFRGHPCAHPMDVLPLGAVCQRWREIAWASPRLWNSLTFRLRLTTTEQMVQLATEWLGRSGKLSLSIYLAEDYKWYETENPRVLIPFLDVVCEVLYRCHYLNLMVLSHFILTRISMKHSFDSPCVLKRLEINCRSYNLSESSPILNFGTAAPLFLKIGYIKLDRFAIHWNNLTEFSATCSYLDDIFQALTLAPNLVKLRQFIDSSAAQTTHSGPLETRSLLCANLQNFYLDGSASGESAGNDEIVLTLLRSITLPKLTIFGVQHCPPFPTTVFLDMVCRSGCAITELSLNEECISADDLVALAKGLPSVTSFSFHLCLESCDALSPFEDLLRVFCLDDQFHDLPSEDDVLFPHLKHISVASSKPVPWEHLPGLKWKFYYWDDGSRTVQPGRPNLESILAVHDFEDDLFIGSRLEYAERYHPPEDAESVPEQLIQDWETFYGLWQLTADVRLDVGIWPDALAFDAGYVADLFALSYRILPKFVGEPPEYIKKFWEAKKWPVSWTIPEAKRI